MTGKPTLAKATAPRQQLDAASWAMLVTLAVLWGSAFVFVEIILTEVPVVTLVGLRVGIAAATLWAAVLLTGTPVPRSAGLWASLMLMGLLNNALPFLLIVWGQTEITAGLAAILNATTPLFAVVLAGLLLSDERLTAQRVGGIALGVLGVAVLIGPGALSSLGENLFHQLAVLGAAISYAAAAVFGRRFGKTGVPPLVVAAGQTTASTAMTLPLALFLHGPASFIPASSVVWLAILANAILSTALAYLLYFEILKRAGAVNVLLVTVLVPIVAVLTGAALLGERLGPGEIGGMTLILFGLVVIDGRVMKAWRSRD